MKNKKISDKKIFAIARNVILSESKAIRSLSYFIDQNFLKAVRTIMSSTKIVLTGIGKSGIIAKKISATFSSTGTASFYIHPVEALHGDIGTIADGDIILALSNSGQTDELNKLLLLLKRKKIRIISITSNPLSKMARLSDIVLNIRVKKEACPYNVVPTTSTTAMLVMGDALAITLMKMKGFDKDNFAQLHPGGNLGRLLNIKASDIMRKGKSNPVAIVDWTVEKVIKIMTKTTLGAISLVDKKGRLCGFFTDGDLRRKIKFISLSEKIRKYMTTNPIFLYPEDMAWKAAKIMQEKNIDNIPVIDKKRRVVGIIDERDLLKEGLM